MNRTKHWQRLQQEPWDVLILGGGINGAGLIRDLALRGGDLKIALVDRAHFSSGTSGKNSQLIHGGLRYLKNLEFALVREALHERQTLLQIAPHLVEPLSFLLPQYGWWDRAQYGAGLTLYDLLAGKANIGPHRRISRDEALHLEPNLQSEGLSGAALFFDGRVHSARLVLENIVEAVGNGATAVNYTEATHWERDSAGWRVHLRDAINGTETTCHTRDLVDARGAWQPGLRLVRGSHIIVPRLNQSEHAIAYFEPDGRIIFFIPWGPTREWTLVGTTDVDHHGSPDDVHISPEETTYLLGMIRQVFPHAGDVPVLTTYSSLRPLVADSSTSATKTSRGHRIERTPEGLLQISGGKYTTYRAMSEEAADLLCQDLAPALADIHRTATTPINGNTPTQIAELLTNAPTIAAEHRLPLATIQHLIRDYGVALPLVLAERHPSEPDADLARLRYAVKNEMAQKIEDVLYISTYTAYERQLSPADIASLTDELQTLLPS